MGVLETPGRVLSLDYLESTKDTLKSGKDSLESARDFLGTEEC